MNIILLFYSIKNQKQGLKTIKEILESKDWFWNLGIITNFCITLCFKN